MTFFSVSASFGRNVESLDIKSAFLQGDKIQRDLYIKPPTEAGRPADCLWQLCKVVYGLCDVSRNWFFSVHRELISMKCVQSTIDKSLFRWYKNRKLTGIFVLHVDDFLYSGSMQEEGQNRDMFENSKLELKE